ncbi:hypothetical protein IAT38_001566 [Cryptococcus sp. DSM 104549]
MRSSAITLFSLLPLLAGVAANTCNRPSSTTADAMGSTATGAADATGATDAASATDTVAGSSGTNVAGGDSAVASVTTDSAAASATDLGAENVATSGAVGDDAAASGTDTAAGSATATADGSATATTADESATAADGSATGAAGATGTATSAAADSTATGTSGTGGTLTLSAPTEDCSCGYTISSLNDVFFPYTFSFAFSSETDRTLSGPDDLSDKGWIVNEGRHAGGEGENGNQCWGRYGNMAIESGDLVLTVPGGQELSSNMSCAEISYGEAVTGGVFQTEAMISNVAGTCEAFWLNHTIADMYADEVDIELLTGKLESDGIYYTNWPPFGNPNDPTTLQSNYTQVPFPDMTSNDPTSTYNNYTIVWLNGDDGQNATMRYFNGAQHDSPTTNLPVHPMNFTINNWMNGAAGWSGGPPTEDAHLRVKNVILYYKTESVATMIDLSSSCTTDDVCKV